MTRNEIVKALDSLENEVQRRYNESCPAKYERKYLPRLTRFAISCYDASNKYLTGASVGAGFMSYRG